MMWSAVVSRAAATATQKRRSLLLPRATRSLARAALVNGAHGVLSCFNSANEFVQFGFGQVSELKQLTELWTSPGKNVEDFTGPRERSDLGFVTFDITADVKLSNLLTLNSMKFMEKHMSLQSIFDWNVKQLFLYLSAEYSTKNNALNQVVLWDKIMLRGDNPRLFLKDMKSKYFFFDDGNGLKGNRNVTLTLSWNVVPNAGILPLVTGSGHVSVPFPDTYETTKSY